MVKKLSLKNDPVEIQKDLERYVKLAEDSGITNAAIVSTDKIIVDERVLMKCRFPLCSEYGACMNCPPNTGSIEDMRARISRFEYAIVLKLDVPGERIASSTVSSGEALEDLKKLCKIVSDVESAAFYDGYYFATGFSAASCHFIWCRGLECQALAGNGCRQRSRVYTSMEAVGIDVYRLAISLDWEIYPVGISATPDIIPRGSRYGMVLIY